MSRDSFARSPKSAEVGGTIPGTIPRGSSPTSLPLVLLLSLRYQPITHVLYTLPNPAAIMSTSGVGLLLKPVFGGLVGPALIGKSLTLFATGVTTVQCYDYFLFNSSRDKWPLKSFVAFFLGLSLLMAVFHLIYFYEMFITGFGDYLEASTVDWTRKVEIFAVPFSTCCGQLFFLHRTYQLSKNRLITAGIVVLAFFTFATAMYCNSFVWAGDVRSAALSTWTEISSWCGVTTDIILCSTFMWYMWKAGLENRGFRKSTDLVIQRLLTMTLSTTLLTTSLTTCVAILTRVQPESVLIFSPPPISLPSPSSLTAGTTCGLWRMGALSITVPPRLLSGLAHVAGKSPFIRS